MSVLPYPLKPANAIHDPVHGRVWLTKVEIELINAPEFQRLRGIGQLTPVDLVFPGATHNRFAHSVGAAHVVGLIASQKHVGAYFAHRDRRRLLQLLRLAALLHDVGHLPFSHVGEMAWLASERADAFAYHDDADGPFTVFDAAAAARARRPLHEELSAMLITESRLAKIIDRRLKPIDGVAASEIVRRIVNGAHPDLVVRNLLSSDLDCDRLDYLLRDSMNAGLVYGHIDLAYLIGTLTVAQLDGADTLAIDGRHGLLTGEHFLLARYYHYAQFVTHKTVAAAEVTLVAAMLELLRLGKLPAMTELTDPGLPASRRVRTLLELDDAHVEAKIAQAARSRGASHLKDAARRLMERKLPKIVAREEKLEPERSAGQAQSHVWDGILGSGEQKALNAGHCGVDPHLFCYRKTDMPLTGVTGDTIKLGNKDDTLTATRKAARVVMNDQPPDLLIKHSFVLKELSNYEWTTRRVFMREPLDSYQPRKATKAFCALRDYLEKMR